MRLDLETLSKMEAEVKRFQTFIDDCRARIESTQQWHIDNGWAEDNVSIDSTAQSSALKSGFKVFVYNMGKIFKS